MATAALSCTSARSGGFDSALPGARIDATQTTIRAWRENPAPLSPATRAGLVDSLRSDDELVRFMTIQALAEMTGTTRGYRWDAGEAERLASIDVWTAWARDPSVNRSRTEVGRSTEVTTP
ncbi:MAG: hypothetical protein SGJ11_14930 [Phycisphaerae bacterium]|nr:hypothetical protein [Phycisphaerae bacterium]